MLATSTACAMLQSRTAHEPDTTLGLPRSMIRYTGLCPTLGGLGGDHLLGRLGAGGAHHEIDRDAVALVGDQVVRVHTR